MSSLSSLSQLYEKSVKKVSGVYIQTKQNSLKFLSALNINITNKPNENTEIERKSKNTRNIDLENYNKESKCIDSKPPFYNPITPHQIEDYHHFISDAPPSYNYSTEYYHDEDDDASNINSPSSEYSINRKNAYFQKSSDNIDEKDLSDQESYDDHDDYFSRTKSNYSTQSSSSSVSSTNYGYCGYNELALTPLLDDENDEGFEIIDGDEVKYSIDCEKSIQKNSKGRKSTMKSISSQKSDRSIRSIRSIKSRKSISKLSLRLNKKKSSSSTMTADTVGTINYEEFISSLDTSEDIEDRLQWLFGFFDMDSDGFITRGEMQQIMDTLI